MEDYYPSWPTTLGFYFSFFAGRGSKAVDSWIVLVPLWLPTVLLAGLNWFVWRKTRAKPVGRAFPVEA